jgi:integration host factor subunit alpha
MAFTKNDMVHAIYTRLDLPKHKSEEVVESLLEIMKRTSVKEKRERMGRNPETGKKMLLRARRIVTFTTSGILRGRINGKV